jgi:hypothetical protein
MKRWICAVFVAAALGCADEPGTERNDATGTAGTAAAVDRGWWSPSEFDLDADRRISREEFYTRWEAGFAIWDTDGDGALDADEAAEMFWEWFTGSDDERMTEQEWRDGTERWNFEHVDWGRWERWDTDSDGQLTEEEWRQGWRRLVWPAWDVRREGLVKRDEMGDAFWSWLSRNGREFIDEEDWPF